MTITAKFSGTCPTCRQPIRAGEKVDWAKGSQARHVSCASTGQAQPQKVATNRDAQKFNGYGAARGGYRRACKTDGNCSSFGSGRSCGGHDCDGF